MKSYTHFTLSERESLQLFLEQDLSIREIARCLNRNPSSVSREIKRNRSNNFIYSSQKEMRPKV